MDSVTVPSLKAAKIEQLHNTVKDSEVQLSLIRDRLDKLNKKGSTVQQNNSKDWTAIYERCMDWEKIEDLKEQKTKYEQTLETIANHQETMGHYHDHSKEKEFFELPEVEKIRQCHANKDIGNYLFSEGNFRRAIDHYQTAVCYYEYCFPEDDVLQEELDNFRHSCLCNLALCYIRTGNYRAAIDSAERVLQENGDHSKALYRKAQAHRYLDEFDEALNCLHKAMRLQPNDSALREELRVIVAHQAGYQQLQKEMAQRILNGSTNSDSSSNEQRVWKETDMPYLSVLDVNRPVEPIMPISLQRYNLKMMTAVKPANRW